MALTRSYKAGAGTRLYIGNTATTALTADADYKYVANETSLTVSFDADENSAVMKGEPGTQPHRAVETGLDTCEFSLEGEERYTDAGFVLLRTARNKVWPYQVREIDDAGVEKVIVQVLGNASQLEFTAGAEGTRAFSVTINSAGPISEPNRTVIEE